MQTANDNIPLTTSNTDKLNMNTVYVRAHQCSFLDTDPNADMYNDVCAFIVDPTCSGSGMYICVYGIIIYILICTYVSAIRIVWHSYCNQ